MNTLIIMSDEHARGIAGCYGNPHVHTPNIDALAARGTRFSQAYCNSPICVPSRASFHTGDYVHAIRFWDNAMPYDGSVPSWGHGLRQAGRPAVSIGKLHFRSSEDDNGFDEEIVPMHVLDGVGDVASLLRRNPVPRSGRGMAENAGIGTSPYWPYDCGVADRAAAWLKDRGKSTSGWTLFVSFVFPHFPLLAPEAFYRLYDDVDLPLPKLRGTYTPENRTVADLRRQMRIDDHFTTEASVRTAIQAYYGLVSALDHNIGRVLAALSEVGLGDETRVIYTSDHGDNLGARGFWAKSTPWEESIGVPLIMAGPGIAAGAVCETPVSLLDIYPTVLDWAGVPQGGDGAKRPGRSLTDIAAGAEPDRTVLSEYHAVFSATGMFMVRWGHWKLIACVGDSPILYDLAADPEETVNRAADPACADVLAEGERRLRAIVDPEAADRLAFADQAARIEQLGGEAVVRAVAPMTYTKPPRMA